MGAATSAGALPRQGRRFRRDERRAPSCSASSRTATRGRAPAGRRHVTAATPSRAEPFSPASLCRRGVRAARRSAAAPLDGDGRQPGRAPYYSRRRASRPTARRSRWSCARPGRWWPRRVGTAAVVVVRKSFFVVASIAWGPAGPATPTHRSRSTAAASTAAPRSGPSPSRRASAAAATPGAPRGAAPPLAAAAPRPVVVVTLPRPQTEGFWKTTLLEWSRGSEGERGVWRALVAEDGAVEFAYPQDATKTLFWSETADRALRAVSPWFVRLAARKAEVTPDQRVADLEAALHGRGRRRLAKRIRVLEARRPPAASPVPPSDEDEAGAAPAAIARHLPPVAAWRALAAAGGGRRRRCPCGGGVVSGRRRRCAGAPRRCARRRAPPRLPPPPPPGRRRAARPRRLPRTRRTTRPSRCRLLAGRSVAPPVRAPPPPGAGGKRRADVGWLLDDRTCCATPRALARVLVDHARLQ